jgi:hypothetical protein
MLLRKTGDRIDGTTINPGLMESNQFNNGSRPNSLIVTRLESRRRNNVARSD